MDTSKPLRSSSSSGGIVVFGGGTATNSLVDVFEKLRESRGCTLQYVIPISDNGGSSSELIRVFGGPGIGDVRSRLVRLIPPSEADAERTSLKSLFNHRLSSDTSSARVEWLDIVEGRHPLWDDISSEKRELIRSVFNHMNMEIVRRARPSSVFNFAKASIGNLFLTGKIWSLESAIYLLSSICAIPSTVATLPAINSNFTHHISAGLEDGSQITGQNAISHPSAPTSLPDAGPTESPSPSPSPSSLTPLIPTSRTSTPLPRPNLLLETEAHDRIEDATLPGSLPSLRKQYITFTKSPLQNDDLSSRISRIWYINPYGHEIYPVANPKVLSSIAAARTIVYSIGSLYTSLVPSLILRGVGAAVRAPHVRQKILILNSSIDRETGPSGARALTAADFVRAIARACAESEGRHYHLADSDPNGTLGQPPVTEQQQQQGHAPPELQVSHDGTDVFSVRDYVTHLLYLEGEGAPRVDRAELAALGVDCVRVYGRRQEDGVLRYDEAGLAGALEAVVGKAEMARSRRNTSGQ
ncbi:hypothetical protein FHL15_005600 [Xylaria flabelliformis]|uniref:Uncharacterized protein n=1 Tax=Xylaria flabelliformis TaxID=2512241 RepID=A0A553I098_9PEZI|nr:hypothetical protein FHL15_005600 [Xylaria flabelliformis]